MTTGRCACERVRFEIDGPIKHITHCHCSICRRAHGAAFATYGALSRKRFRITAGEDQLRTFVSSEKAVRNFCSACGTPLFWSHLEHPDVIDVSIGTVDGDPGGRAKAHIFVGSKAPWFEITDGLPQYEAEFPQGD
jgi:hypothetical protein